MEEQENWKKSVEQKLDNIYNEMTDGAVRKGLFSQVKQNTEDIKGLKATVDSHKDVIEDYQTIRKLTIKALWLGVVALAGKIAWWVWDLFKLSWKVAAMVWASTGGNHNT